MKNGDKFNADHEDARSMAKRLYEFGYTRAGKLYDMKDGNHFKMSFLKVDNGAVSRVKLISSNTINLKFIRHELAVVIGTKNTKPSVAGTTTYSWSRVI